MSYILDALKKSEQERKLGQLPDISSEHNHFDSNFSSTSSWKWIVLLLFVLILLLGFILYFVFQGEKYTVEKPAVAERDNQNTQVVHDGLNAVASNTVDVDQERLSDDSVVAPLESGLEIIRPSSQRRQELAEQQEVEAQKNQKLIAQYKPLFETDAELNARQNAEPQEVIESEEPVETESKTSLTTNAATGPRENKLQWKNTPSIADLPLSVQNKLPSIKVSTHIYSSAESYRKVTINEKGARQGADLGDGIVLEAITEEGVILDFNGQRFRMKALESWK